MLIQEKRIPIREILFTGWMPSALKVLYYRIKGARVGKRVKIGFGSVLLAQKLEIGDDTTIGFATIIRGREVKIGSHTCIGSTTFIDVERIFIGEDVKINEQVFAGGPMFPDSYLHIGNRTTVMQHTFLNPSKPLIIHDGAGIGGRCSIFTHSSWQNILDGYPVKFAPIVIGENAWIPWDVFILPGVTIGAGATVGAGSLVTKDVLDNSLVAGVPAKLIRGSDDYISPPTKEDKIAILKTIVNDFLDFITYHGFSIEEIKNNEDVFDAYRVQNHLGSSVGSVRIFFSTFQLVDEMNETESLTIISLTEIIEEHRKLLNDKKILWVDINNCTRGGTSNKLGEQLIDFLKRYGIHLRRYSVS